MKNLIRIPLTLTLLFATCCLCLGQEFYRGELFVTGQHFSLTNGHLNVELSVDFEGLRMPSDESLTVTPVLKNGEYEQELPAVLINGAEKQKVYQRTQALAAGKRNNAKVRTSPIPAVVIRNDHAASRAFTYKVSVPYEQWMERATLIFGRRIPSAILSSSTGRRNKKYIRGHRLWRLVNAIMLRYALRQFRQW